MSSDENPSYDRRKRDKRIDELEANLHGVLIAHIENDHTMTVVEINTKVEEHDLMVRTVRRIADLLDGSADVNAHGEVINRTGGLLEVANRNADMLETIEHRTNGGVRVTYKAQPEWTRGQKLAATGIGVSIFLGMLPAIVWSVQSIAQWVLAI